MKLISCNLDSDLNECFTIREVKMKLTPDHYAKIKAKLKLLENRSPALSSIELQFLRGGRKIKGSLCVTGAENQFMAMCTGTNPWKIYQKLEQEVDYQLLKWKKNRFSPKHNTTKIININPKPKRSYAV